MCRYSTLWHDDDDQALKRNKLAYMVCRSMYVAGSVSKYILHRVATETIGTSHSGACHYHSVVAATGT